MAEQQMRVVGSRTGRNSDCSNESDFRRLAAGTQFTWRSVRHRVLFQKTRVSSPTLGAASGGSRSVREDRIEDFGVLNREAAG